METWISPSFPIANVIVSFFNVYPSGAVISVNVYFPAGSFVSSVGTSPDTKLIVDLSSLTVSSTASSPRTAVIPERSALSRLVISSLAPGSSSPPPTAVLLIVALITSSFTLIVLLSTAV